jgi:glucose dehydrogenase
VRPARVVIAVLLALVGLVWTLQGLNVIGGSAMSGTPFWAVVGIGLIVGAIGVVATELRRRDGTGGSDAGSGGTGEPPAA